MANKYDKILGAYREDDAGVTTLNGTAGAVTVEGSNIGTGEPIYNQATVDIGLGSTTLEFKNITSSDGSVAITSNATDVDLSVAAGTSGIPQYDSDPGSPAAEDAWVLRTAGSPSSPAGEPVGLLFAITSAGSAAGADLYQFSYQTVEGTIKRITLS